MGKASRDKGKRGEIRARDLLRPIYPDAYRSANQAGSDACCDVEGTPWFVECKEGKTHRIWAAVRQAVEARDAAGDDRPIVVISHRTRGMTLAVVPMDDHQAELGDTCYYNYRRADRVRWESLMPDPCVVQTNDKQTAVVVMRAADFVELLKR